MVGLAQVDVNLFLLKSVVFELSKPVTSDKELRPATGSRKPVSDGTLPTKIR